MNLKKNVLFMAVSLTVMPLLADDSMQSNSVFPDERAQASYAIGLSYGRYLEERGIDTSLIDTNEMIRGLTDAISGKPLLMPPQEIGPDLSDFLKLNQTAVTINQGKFKRQDLIDTQLLAETNAAIGKAFLDANKNAPGVVTMPDGLEYKVLTDGSGPIPASTNKVLVNYSLRLLDGTLVETSDDAGHAAEILLSAPNVPRGLSETLTQMKVGSVWDTWLPSQLAYGAAGMRFVPPNSTLKFHVELLSIDTNAPPVRPTPPPLTSDIIAVPSADEIKKGAKPYTLTPQQVQQMQSQTNKPN